MSIFSLSSLFNRFAKWAEKQPQINLEKTLGQMEFCSRWKYEDEQESFARKIKGLIKGGAVVGAPELLRALKVEGDNLWLTRYRKGAKLLVVDTMLAAGAVPDDACFGHAVKRGVGCFDAQLRAVENVTPAVLVYAIEMNGQETALINKLMGQCEKMTSGVVFAAMASQTLAKAGKAELVKKAIAAGAPLKWEHVRYAIESSQANIAIDLLSAGAPATPLLMAYAVNHDMRAVAEKLHEKGVSFDDAIVACKGAELQNRMKQYRKAITGEAYVDEALVAQLQKQVEVLTARLEKVEGVTVNKPARAAAKAAVKPK